MLRSVLMDSLSEFLMVEQCGLELYRVVAERATMPDLKKRYVEFGKETAQHRQVLVQLIERLGGDPNYVSPGARVAQFKAAKLLESSLAVDGMSQMEIEKNDLENVLLAETKDHADWHLLELMAQQAGKPGDMVGSMAGAAVTAVKGGPADQVDSTLLREALQDAVSQVEDEEDEHLAWAREKLSELCLRMGTVGPAPPPERWQEQISTPETPIEQFHPAPIQEGLLEGAQLPPWQPSTIARDMLASAKQ